MSPPHTARVPYIIIEAPSLCTDDGCGVRRSGIRYESLPESAAGDHGGSDSTQTIKEYENKSIITVLFHEVHEK